MVSPFQRQRFELKYILDEARTSNIRDFLRPYLELDAYGALQPDRSYSVHSLYLDSPDLTLHQSTINGDRNRFKLRVRYYEDDPDRPVFFEIKRREDNTIFKERCPVRRSSASEILAGRLPSRTDLAYDGRPAEERALHDFCQQVNSLRARPVAHVRYRREAWHGLGDTRIRVTMDRQVRSCPETRSSLCTQLSEEAISVFGNAVVLELKFTNRFPEWMAEMVRVFGLRPCSAAKYVDGILGMEDQQIILTNPTHAQLRNTAERRKLKQIQFVRQGQ
ncbi:MAG: polyphosphate polymerase domain-containing protein [Opitutales bacterium]|nr:polyphosphate polymerase domain-containing protein [Opitutales bacterium]